jgi:hypothetical protein
MELELGSDSRLEPASLESVLMHVFPPSADDKWPRKEAPNEPSAPLLE